MKKNKRGRANTLGDFPKNVYFALSADEYLEFLTAVNRLVGNSSYRKYITTLSGLINSGKLDQLIREIEEERYR